MKLQEIKEWYIKNDKLYFASIELTQNCNFRCRHCYCEHDGEDILSSDTYIEIIDKLYSTGCLFLNFTGGEIFTNKDFKKIYLYAKNKGFIIDLLTNISLLNDDIIKLFKEYPPNNIAITLYGTTPEEYQLFTGNKENYYKVMNALNLLKENNIRFVLRTVAAKTLLPSLLNARFEKIAEEFDTTFKYDPIIFPKTSGDKTPLAECLNVKQIVELEKITPLRNIAWKNEICSQKKFNWSCKAGFNSMAIDYKGNAFLCGLFRKYPISIINNNIDKVLEHLHKIHMQHIKIMENNECSRCKYRNICKCCPAYSGIYNNNEYAKIDFFCDLAKARTNAFG